MSMIESKNRIFIFFDRVFVFGFPSNYEDVVRYHVFPCLPFFSGLASALIRETGESTLPSATCCRGLPFDCGVGWGITRFPRFARA